MACLGIIFVKYPHNISAKIQSSTLLSNSKQVTSCVKRADLGEIYVKELNR